jgi:hypothetical protein
VKQFDEEFIVIERQFDTNCRATVRQFDGELYYDCGTV